MVNMQTLSSSTALKQVIKRYLITNKFLNANDKWRRMLHIVSAWWSVCVLTVDLYVERQPLLFWQGCISDDTLDRVTVDFSARRSRQRADCGCRTVVMTGDVSSFRHFFCQSTFEPTHLCSRFGTSCLACNEGNFFFTQNRTIILKACERRH